MSEREKRNRRHLRLRKKVVGTEARPRLLMNRSLHHVHAQLIDDTAGCTLVAASSIEPTLRAQLQGLGTGNQHAAAKIGDDALQKSSGHSVVPESFTHGTSAQRQRWFDNGLRNGSVKGCDTFSARQL